MNEIIISNSNKPGFGSLIAAFKRPLASSEDYGDTTFKPGT